MSVESFTSKEDRRLPFTIITPPLIPDGFNPGVVSVKEGKALCLTRHVPKSNHHGAPDVGEIKLHEAWHDIRGRYAVVDTQTIWRPEQSPNALIEDIRVLKDPFGTRVILGASIIHPDCSPRIGIAVLDNERELPEVAHKFRTYTTLEGKNITPLDVYGNLIFRREGKRFNHKLTQLRYDFETEMVQEIGELDFSKYIPPWGRDRLGLTFPPIPIGNGSTEILIMHGFVATKCEPTEDNPEGVFYEYALGQSALEKHATNLRSVLGIDPLPLLTPFDFAYQDGKRMGGQLHPGLRDAIYCCGALERRDMHNNVFLDAAVSLGDMATFIVSFNMKDLQERHKRLCGIN